MKKTRTLILLATLTVACATSATATARMPAAALSTAPTLPLAFFGWFKKSDDSQKATETKASAEAPTADKKADRDMKATIEDLKKKYRATADLIQKHSGDLEKVTAALRAIPLSEQMSAKAREYQGQIASLTKTLGDLRNQLSGYADQLQALGVPIDALLR